LIDLNRSRSTSAMDSGVWAFWALGNVDITTFR
jgi:hypothetical protein